MVTTDGRRPGDAFALTDRSATPPGASPVLATLPPTWPVYLVDWISMAARLSLRTVPAERREQMDAIRRRENSTLVAASKAEATLSAAEDKLADLVASQEEAITDARVAVGRAYLDVIDAFGSRSRAAEYLGITRHQLKKAVAAVPAETPTEAVRSTAPAPGSGS